MNSPPTASYVFTPPPQPTVPVEGTTALYPVHRIFCVGRNYAEHSKEMGFEQDREAPWYFTKPATAIVLSGATISYPPETTNYHYEIELVVARGAPAHAISVDRALDAVYGYAAGVDMTRAISKFGCERNLVRGSLVRLSSSRRSSGAHEIPRAYSANAAVRSDALGAG